MKRGDVIGVNLPPPDGSPGAEQFGARPAIVVQSNTARANIATLFIVPLTTNQRAMKYQGSVLIQPSGTNGLKAPSVALVHQLRAMDKSRMYGKLGTLGRSDLVKIDAELRTLLNLPASR